jgi:ubiquinone/menaquinone biosynthesis C-methylase UbiE
MNDIRRAQVLSAVLLVSALVVPVVWQTASAADSRRNRDDWQQPARVIEDLHLKHGWRVADVGCGRGYLTFDMARAVGDAGKVYAVDISENALKSLRERAERQNQANIDIVHSAPTDTKLTTASVDAAVVCLVFHHVPEQQRQALLNNIANALVPGGYLYVLDFRTDPPPPFHKREGLLSRETFIELAKQAGLELNAEWFYLEYQYFLRFQRPE